MDAAGASIHKKPPRRRMSRAALAILLWITTFVVAPIAMVTLLFTPLVVAVGEDQDKLAALDIVTPAVGSLISLVIVAWMCPKVSYRWFHSLLSLVPIVGVLIWAPRIMWRMAYLPYRDWRPRADEAADWVRVGDPARPGLRPILTTRPTAPH